MKKVLLTVGILVAFEGMAATFEAEDINTRGRGLVALTPPKGSSKAGWIRADTLVLMETQEIYGLMARMLS
jgi:hypothetical protein